MAKTKREVESALGDFFLTPDAETRARVPINHLIEIGARCMWQHDNRRGTLRIELWCARGKFYLVVLQPEGGWDIYAQVDPGDDIASTLAKVK